METYPAITARMEQQGRALLDERYRMMSSCAYHDVEMVMVEESLAMPVLAEMGGDWGTLTLTPVVFRPRYEGVPRRDILTRQMLTISCFVGWDCLNPRRETEEV